MTLEQARTKFQAELEQIIAGITPVRQRYSPALRAVVNRLYHNGHSLQEIRTAFGLQGNALAAIVKKQQHTTSSAVDFVPIKPQQTPAHGKNHERFLPEVGELTIGSVVIKIGY